MTKKGKYIFNPESLQFESVRKSIWRRIQYIATLIISSFLIAVVYYIVYSLFFDTPMERAKKRENKILSGELIKINERYEQLNQVVLDISRRDTNIYRAIFEANPLNLSALNQTSDPKYFKRIEKADNNELILFTKEQLAYMENEGGKLNSKLDSMKLLYSKDLDKLNFIPAIQPVDNKGLSAAGASVGEKINPFYKSLKIHTGMDFAVPVGSNVYATANGTVKEHWFSQSGSGNKIVIDHGNDYETRYLYLNELFVRRGDKVTRGQVIGKVGNLGMTVPHLHYEVRKGGKVADPLNYFFLELNAKQYEQIMAISLNNGQSLD